MKRFISIVMALGMTLSAFVTSHAADFDSGMNGATKLSGVTLTDVRYGTGNAESAKAALKTALVDGVYNQAGQITATNLTGGHWQVNKDIKADYYVGASFGNEAKTVNCIAFHGGAGTTSTISDADIASMYVYGDNGKHISINTAKTKRYNFSAANEIRAKEVVYLYFNESISTKTLWFGFDKVLTAALRICEIEYWNTGDNKLTGSAVSSFYPKISGKSGSSINAYSSAKDVGYLLTDADMSGGFKCWSVELPTNMQTAPFVEYDVNDTINELVIYSGYESGQSWVLPENICFTYTEDGTNWITAKTLEKINNTSAATGKNGYASLYKIGAITPKKIRVYVPYGKGQINLNGTSGGTNLEEFRIREIEAYYDDSFTESAEEDAFALRMDETTDFTAVNSTTIVRKDAVVKKGASSRTFMLQFPTPVSDKAFTVNDVQVTPAFSTETFDADNGDGTGSGVSEGKVYIANVTIDNMIQGEQFTIKVGDTEVYNFSVQEDYELNCQYSDDGTNKTYAGTITNNTDNTVDLQLFLVGKTSEEVLTDCDYMKINLAAGETKDVLMSIGSVDCFKYAVYVWDENYSPKKMPLESCKAIDLNDEALSYYGRWTDIDGAKYANWNHPYVNFAFTGTELQVDAENVAYLAVTIDGARKTYQNVNGKINVVPNALVNKEHKATIKIYKSSLAQNQAIKGIYIGSNDKISKVPTTKNVLQFIGDSITTDPASYSYTIPEHYGYDFSIISLSGIALQDGCGWYGKNAGDLPSTDLIGMESAYFNRQNPLFDGTGKTATPYDFANENPNVIVINLGANDNEFITKPDIYKVNGKTPETYIESYVSFVNKVRGVHPDAEIYIMESLIHENTNPDKNSLSYEVLINAQKQVYSRLQSDTKVHYIDTSTWDVQSNDNLHPTPEEYAKLRDVVYNAISPSLK